MNIYQLFQHVTAIDEAYGLAAQKLAQEMTRVAGHIPNALYAQRYRSLLRDFKAAQKPGELEKKL